MVTSMKVSFLFRRTRSLLFVVPLSSAFMILDVDMLENVEIGEQKRRNDAYKAAKKGTGVYADK